MHRRSFFSLLLLAVPARACLWDGDTLRDEAVQKGSLYDFITGQFPHHGSGYYQARVRRLTAAGALDHSGRNDLAAAFIRLEQWEKAEVLLKQNLAAQPGDYFTLSNLGVLEKKRGRYAQSSEWIGKALAIKPEGHLGLGDWYLKNLQYRTAVAAASGKPPVKDFLGLDYAQSFKPVFDSEKSSQAASPAEEETRLRLQRMLENDQTFADGFLVAGDNLARRGDLNLAFLCYRRAQQLKHPNSVETSRRLKGMYQHFNQLTYSGSSNSDYRAAMARVKEKYDSASDRAFAAAADWLKVFQKTEAELVTLHGDEKASVELVMQTLQTRGVKLPLP